MNWLIKIGLILININYFFNYFQKFHNQKHYNLDYNHSLNNLILMINEVEILIEMIFYYYLILNLHLYYSLFDLHFHFRMLYLNNLIYYYNLN